MVFFLIVVSAGWDGWFGFAIVQCHVTIIPYLTLFDKIYIVSPISGYLQEISNSLHCFRAKFNKC